MKAKKVKHERVAGTLYASQNGNKPTLVLFNQWRSGASSIFSEYLADMVLERKVYGAVLFADRIASGGASDNQLSKAEKKRMSRVGDFQFAQIYHQAVERILAANHQSGNYVLGGSSAGGSAALAAASASGSGCSGVVLVEPSGLRPHGMLNNVLAVPHAFLKHVVAYRHRISRGWWTPMDREQYFATGSMFEKRARYWASDRFKKQVMEYVADSSNPPLTLVLSKDSHVHRAQDRREITENAVKPHRLKLITGNHDKICQPPSLSKLYELT
ncbi:MAG: hypothetical protein U5L95_01230 [Candidatus Saccharibacteria bacterium]|nr:hypothetical protein [Candidatus Saccharibacteria bacterium]